LEHCLGREQQETGSAVVIDEDLVLWIGVAPSSSRKVLPRVTRPEHYPRWMVLLALLPRASLLWLLKSAES
jgi:hypothetical protein